MQSLWILSGAFSLVVGCGGVERDAHYPHQKQFGRGDQTLVAGPGTETEEEVSVEAPSSTTSTMEAPPATTQQAEANNEPSSTTPQLPVEPPPETEPERAEVIPEIKIDPNLVVVSALYRGVMDKGSLRLLTKEGEALNPATSAIGNRLLSGFQPKADMKFFSSQTYGDEETGVSQVFQHGFSQTGDLGVMFGDESESGSQILQRVVGDKRCPAAMVCIRSMVWQPITGATKTYCYRDVESRKLTSIPYAPAPNFSLKDMEAAAGSIGPIAVERYPGKVDCQKLNGARAEYSQQIYVRSIVNTKPQMKYLIQKSGRVAPDFSVRMIVDKRNGVTPSNMQPYVDQSTRLQSDAEYFISAKQKNLVKVVKHIRKSIRFAGDGSWIGSLVRAINYVSPIEGIAADVHVEFCTNLKRSDQPSLCPETVGE